jgi:hypothetical protein
MYNTKRVVLVADRTKLVRWLIELVRLELAADRTCGG